MVYTALVLLCSNVFDLFKRPFMIDKYYYDALEVSHRYVLIGFFFVVVADAWNSIDAMPIEIDTHLSCLSGMINQF